MDNKNVDEEEVEETTEEEVPHVEETTTPDDTGAPESLEESEPAELQDVYRYKSNAAPIGFLAAKKTGQNDDGEPIFETESEAHARLSEMFVMDGVDGAWDEDRKGFVANRKKKSRPSKRKRQRMKAAAASAETESTDTGSEKPAMGSGPRVYDLALVPGRNKGVAALSMITKISENWKGSEDDTHSFYWDKLIEEIGEMMEGPDVEIQSTDEGYVVEGDSRDSEMLTVLLCIYHYMRTRYQLSVGDVNSLAALRYQEQSDRYHAEPVTPQVPDDVEEAPAEEEADDPVAEEPEADEGTEETV